MDRPVGKYGLDTIDKRPHRPEAKHLSAARIGRDQPADRRASPRAKRQRKAQALPRNGLMQRLEHDAGLRLGAHCRRVDRADPVHAPERQDQGAAVLGRRRSANHRGVATLWHKTDPGFACQLNDRRDFLGRRRLEDRPRLAVPASAPVAQPRLDVRLVRNFRPLAEPRADFIDQ